MWSWAVVMAVVVALSMSGGRAAVAADGGAAGSFGAGASDEGARELPSAEAAAPKIVWRVENPFRFFQDKADAEMHRATYLALSEEERQRPVLSAERALAGRTDEGWAAAVHRKTCWDSRGNRYACPNDRTPYAFPTTHAVIAEIEGFADAPSSLLCTWAMTAAGGAETSALQAQPSRTCSEPVRFVVPYPAGATITVEVGGGGLARADVRVRDVFVVGVGDSFGSGEGNPDVPVRFSRERTADYGGNGGANGGGALFGLPARVGAWRQIGDKDFAEESARWLDQACHRSLYSHQLRVALQLAIEDPHRAVTFASFACSGAEVVQGLFLRYKGNEWVPNPPELSQVSAVAEVQCGAVEAAMQDLPEAYHIGGRIPDLQGGLVLRKCDATDARRIDVLLVSVGGNDIGFARLVANAVLTDQSLLKKLGGWFGQVFEPRQARARFAEVDARYKALKRAIHNILHVPWNESDRVILTAYPGMSLLDNGRNICPDGQAGMEVFPDFRLSEEKARDSERVADQLNGLMKQAADTYGWSFADAHRAQFVGRGLCAGFTDNALSQADDLRIPRKVDSEWRPYNPADFKPYASRQRWFRTPNDAFLTGNFHASAGVMQRVLKIDAVSFIQVMLAATYSGAFHPTAEGHAAIADAALLEARTVLDKYAADRRRR